MIRSFGYCPLGRISSKFKLKIWEAWSHYHQVVRTSLWPFSMCASVLIDWTISGQYPQFKHVSAIGCCTQLQLYPASERLSVDVYSQILLAHVVSNLRWTTVQSSECYAFRLKMLSSAPNAFLCFWSWWYILYMKKYPQNGPCSSIFVHFQLQFLDSKIWVCQSQWAACTSHCLGVRLEALPNRELPETNNPEKQCQKNIRFENLGISLEQI